MKGARSLQGEGSLYRRPRDQDLSFLAGATAAWQRDTHTRGTLGAENVVDLSHSGRTGRRPFALYRGERKEERERANDLSSLGSSTSIQAGAGSLPLQKEGRKEGRSRHTGERGARMTLNLTGAPPGIGVRNSDSERKRSKER